MRARKLLSAFTLTAAAALAACQSGGDLAGAPEDTGPPGGPGSAPPTGGKWEGRETTDECGRTTIEWLVVDEVCGGTTDPRYLDNFRAPILRDGARVGDRLYAVDATHLWVLDVGTPSAPQRSALVAGFGQPLGVAVHDGRLLVAAGAEGLIVADVSSPDAPVRLATVELPGPALDVFVDGDRAYVAAGDAGVVEVDLGAAAVSRTLPVEGFVAGVAVRGGVAFVAACDTVVTLDLASGAELGSTWLEDAYSEEGVLVAPAKDVLAVGDDIFVAAGRYGAVRIDVRSPSSPEILGNCTIEDHLGFYASGLRSQDDRLFVAGGEWGVLPIELGDPDACTSFITPELIPALGGGGGAEEGEECSSEPPWEVLPWAETWLPPVQPNQDPLQTLPVGDVLYAFGDATRIGMRAVDVRLARAPELDHVGRYDEPRLASAIAAHDARVLVLGREGGLFVRDGDTLVREAGEPAEVTTAIDAAFLGDGRWVMALAEPRRLAFEGGPTTVIGGASEAVWPGTLATLGTRAILSDATGASVVDASGGAPQTLATGRAAVLPAAVTMDASGFVLAAPEWTEAVRVSGDGTTMALGPHGIFGAQEAASVNEWRVALPRRLLTTTPVGVLELATLGRRAGVALHQGSSAPIPLELPPGEYVDLSSDGARAFAVSIDRGTYRSQLVTIDLGSGAPRIVSIDTWTGMAAGVAATPDGVFVVDRDRGVRLYDDAVAGPELVAVVALGGVP